MREALEPFAEAADVGDEQAERIIGATGLKVHDNSLVRLSFAIGDLRRARSILAYPGGKSEEPTERAQIVAWLRQRGNTEDYDEQVALWYANAIERREHLPGGKSDQGEKADAAAAGVALEEYEQKGGVTLDEMKDELRIAPLSRSGDSALVEAVGLLREIYTPVDEYGDITLEAQGTNKSWNNRRKEFLKQHGERK